MPKFQKSNYESEMARGPNPNLLYLNVLIGDHKINDFELAGWKDSPNECLNFSWK